MPRNTRSILYNALKDLGWTPEKGFTGYTAAELSALLVDMGEEPEVLIAAAQTPDKEEPVYTPQPPEPEVTRSNVPDPDTMAGARLITDPDILRIDDEGREWYQEEVRKPAYPKPRGRRVLTYVETGVQTQTIQSGEYIETFEVAGDGPGRTAEIKITLPSYQTGIYKDPRFPFRVHCYNDNEGFDLFEVEEYFGGAELVPASVKRKYVENELCYDMRSVINTIQAMYREMQLRGQV